MKRSITILLALGLAMILSAPAAAEDKAMEERIAALENVFSGLSIYGSVRYDTFYMESDNDMTSDSDSVSKNVTSSALTGPDQKATQWGLASNTRLGVTVKRADNIGGRFEYGFKSDGSVSLRLGYGTYAINGVTFLIGQDYTPLSEWDYSNQVFNSDNNLAGWGMIDTTGKRTNQMKMKWNGLQIALVTNKDTSVLNLPSTATDAHTQVLLPVLQAKYRFTADRMFADVFGGVGSYKVKCDSLDVDESVTSWAAGLGGGVKLDPAYAKAMVWWAQNGKQMGLHQADAAGAQFKPDYSISNDDDFGCAFVAGVLISKVTVEAGYGFVSSRQDVSGGDKNEASNYYLNATIPVEQNIVKTAAFFLVPEVGVYDYMKSATGADQGTITYAGAKWQVNF